MQRSSVVLPTPFGPSTDRISRSLTEKAMSRRTGTES